jgi:hypothetical protein
MWVKAREREKNKEKCVNGATFLTEEQAVILEWTAWSHTPRETEHKRPK